MTLRVAGDETTGWRPTAPALFLKDANAPSFSPDGRWLLYTARGSASVGTEVFVRPYPGPGSPRQISIQGGTDPVWSSKNAEVFYATPDHQIMTASYSVSSGAFQAEKPRGVPNSQFSPRVVGRSFDLHPDGERFALVKAAAVGAKRNHVTLIFNFFEELRTITTAAPKRSSFPY